MLHTVKAVTRDLVEDGSKIVTAVSPLLSVSYWVAKIFFGAELKIENWSWAWGLVPITVWLAVAYFRRRQSHMRLLADIEPQVTFLGLQTPSDQVGGPTSLEIKNRSRAKALAGCIAQIEKLLDHTGKEVIAGWPLRTADDSGNPSGRFDLAPEQTKKILLCARELSNNYEFRIIGADGKTKKLEKGRYDGAVKIFQEGAPPLTVNFTLSGGVATERTPTQPPSAA